MKAIRIAVRIFTLIAVLALGSGLSTTSAFAAAPRKSDTSASGSKRYCQINFKQDFVIANNQTGIITDIQVDENCVVTTSKRIVSAAEAQRQASSNTKDTKSMFTNLELQARVNPLAIVTKTCHSYIGVLDPINIELTGLTHNTIWDSNGAIVGLRSMSTSAGWHFTTGWAKTGGPGQWVVDGNGGVTDKTHGEASFKWIGGQHAHTLKAENTVRSNGTCTGTLWVVGVIPSISHTKTSVWVN